MDRCLRWLISSSRGHSKERLVHSVLSLASSCNFQYIYNQTNMAAATMSSVLGSRAAQIKPFSARPSQRRVIVRAGDPAAPDPKLVDGSVRECECPCCSLLQMLALGPVPMLWPAAPASSVAPSSLCTGLGPRPLFLTYC